MIDDEIIDPNWCPMCGEVRENCQCTVDDFGVTFAEGTLWCSFCGWPVELCRGWRGCEAIVVELGMD